MWKSLLTITICLIYCVNPSKTQTENARTLNVLDKLKSSFQLAGQLIGIDKASNVAKLVSETFENDGKKGDTHGDNPNIFSGFLRLLGFDSKKIGAIAINAIIFVAQLISSSLSRPVPSQLTEARQIPNDTPFNWMMRNGEVINMLSEIKNKNLPNQLISYIKENSMDEETDCVQLLICKSAPFIWGMQKALNNSSENETIKGPKILYAYFPSLEEVTDNADKCDTKHPYCFINF